jgi:L-aspartate oxidase
MLRFDERAELAPRDIVARAIDYEIKRLGIRHVWLDITHKSPEFITEHFPTLYARLLELGIDITKDMIPVVPAAHYTCGGVMVDSSSQTDLTGLYAIGETSYTGLHGANRMASNSLLECFVYGMSAAEDIEQKFDAGFQFPKVPAWDESQVTDADEDVVILQNWDELRSTMWNYVGIVRTTKRLQRALHRIEMLKREITEYYQDYRVSKNLIELRNLVLVSEMIVRCAMQRKESRGLHYTLDYPELSSEIRKTVLTPPNFAVEQPLVNT